MQPFFDAYPDNSGRSQHAPAFADHVEDVVLAADTPLRVAVPAGARFVLFSFDGDVRIRAGGADVLVRSPTQTSGDGGGGELNPAARRLVPASGTAATHIAFRAPVACTGSVSFYA
jgi:hypothetical protein